MWKDEFRKVTADFMKLGGLVLMLMIPLFFFDDAHFEILPSYCGIALSVVIGGFWLDRRSNLASFVTSGFVLTATLAYFVYLTESLLSLPGIAFGIVFVLWAVAFALSAAQLVTAADQRKRWPLS